MNKQIDNARALRHQATERVSYFLGMTSDICLLQEFIARRFFTEWDEKGLLVRTAGPFDPEGIDVCHIPHVNKVAQAPIWAIENPRDYQTEPYGC